jgi:hypothetical protein
MLWIALVLGACVASLIHTRIVIARHRRAEHELRKLIDRLNHPT